VYELITETSTSLGKRRFIVRAPVRKGELFVRHDTKSERSAQDWSGPEDSALTRG
jgi:hypothetical protein